MLCLSHYWITILIHVAPHYKILNFRSHSRKFTSVILVVTNQLKSSITQQGMIQFAFTVLKKLQYKMQMQNFLQCTHAMFKTKDKK